MAQNKDFTVIPCGEQKTLVFIYGGIVFEPLNESLNVSDSVLINIRKEEFYLNGLKIDKCLFISLHLSSRDLSNNNTTFFNRKSCRKGHGIYEYYYNKDNDYENKIIFRINTKLPIFLNGIELEVAKQKDILSKIEPNNIISVIHKKVFLKRGRIEIITK